MKKKTKTKSKRQNDNPLKDVDPAYFNAFYLYCSVLAERNVRHFVDFSLLHLKINESIDESLQEDIYQESLSRFVKVGQVKTKEESLTLLNSYMAIYRTNPNIYLDVESGIYELSLP